MTEEVWNIRRRYIIRRFPIPEAYRIGNHPYLELVDDVDRMLVVSSPYVSIKIISCQVTETELIIVTEHVEKRDRIK